MKSVKNMTLSIMVLAVIFSLVFSGMVMAKTEITLLGHWSQEQFKHVEPYFNEYEKLHPDIKVNFQPVSFGELLTKIQIGAVSGQRPDIYHIYNAWLPQLVENNILAKPASNYQDLIADRFSPAAVKGTTYNGTTWGFPTEVDDYALLYNKELLKKAGYDRPPKNWDELREYAKKLTIKDDSGNVTQAGFATWIGDVSGVVHPFYSLLYSNGGQVLTDDKKKAAFNSPAGLAALKLYNEIVATPTLSAYEDFSTGNVAMIVFAPWGKLFYHDQMGDDFSKIESALIPKKERYATISYSWSMVVDNNSPNKEEAWKFVQWLNTVTDNRNTSRIGDYFAEDLGAIPSNKKDLENHEEQLGGSYMQTYLEGLQYAVPEPMVIPANEINKELQKQIEAVLNDQKTPEQALKDAEKKVNSILADY